MQVSDSSSSCWTNAVDAPLIPRAPPIPPPTPPPSGDLDRALATPDDDDVVVDEDDPDDPSTFDSLAFNIFFSFATRGSIALVAVAAVVVEG